MTHEPGVSGGIEDELVEVCVTGRVGAAGHQQCPSAAVDAAEVIESEVDIAPQRRMIAANPSSAPKVSLTVRVRKANGDFMFLGQRTCHLDQHVFGTADLS